MLSSSILRFGPQRQEFLRLIACGFAYWVTIVSALEPGNIAAMLSQGDVPHWADEAMRIVGAGLIGSMSVPVFVQLSRWFPVTRPRLTRNAMIHLACAGAVAAILIALAHIVASQIFSDGGISLSGLADDLAANELLLVLGLIGLSGLAHFFLSRAQPVSSQAIQTVEVKVRGLTRLVPLEQIDWIETQGNYLALHVGSSTYLVRDTLTKFQAGLDPARFIRIHRRTIVAVDRIAAVEPAANGDGVARLRDGQALRVSRLYRKTLRN